MALIDVSDLLVDPDFVDPIELISSVTKVNGRGENVLVPVKSVSSVGSVQPASADTVSRLPDAVRTEDIRSFFYKGEIVASKKGEYSSILVYRGERFLVMLVHPWNNYGQGWSEGVCVRETAI